MNNKIIKSVILLLAIGIIITIVVITRQSVEHFERQEIRPFDFAQYVSQKIDTQIVGTAAQAMIRYYDVYDIITTEDNILVDSEKVLSDSTAASLYSTAFQKYWQIYDGELYAFFNQSSWPKEDRDNIASHLKALQKRRGCENLDDIKKYEGYLAGYKEATKIIKDAKKCTSIKTYKKVRKDYTNYYNKYPYYNVDQLQTELRHVPNDAKESLENHIVKKINKVCNDRSYENDANLVRFIEDYEKLYDEGKQCNQELSSPKISNALERLDNYYNELSKIHYMRNYTNYNY